MLKRVKIINTVFEYGKSWYEKTDLNFWLGDFTNVDTSSSNV